MFLPSLSLPAAPLRTLPDRPPRPAHAILAFRNRLCSGGAKAKFGALLTCSLGTTNRLTRALVETLHSRVGASLVRSNCVCGVWRREAAFLLAKRRARRRGVKGLFGALDDNGHRFICCSVPVVYKSRRRRLKKALPILRCTGFSRSSRMPKESRKHLSSGSQGLRYKPYSRYGQSVAQDTCSTECEDSAERKEWEEATCPVCMEHPHNAVLLICSSYGKGCRPYMCDTSYRHSNCLDQYRKAHELRDALPSLSSSHRLLRGSEQRAIVNRVEDSEEDETAAPPPAHEEEYLVEGGGDDDDDDAGLEQVSVVVGTTTTTTATATEEVDAGELLCPLCRGKVKGWKVVEAARSHLNQKLRSCAQESCNFDGPYEELRKHARCTHPSARPSEIDRNRLDRWMQLERQRELGDVLSTMPGATVLGDYVIEGDDGGDDEDGEDTDYPGSDGNWWTVFLLFQVFGQPSMAGGRGLPGSLVRGRFHPSSRGAPRSALWGEAMAGNSTNRLGGGGNPVASSENLGAAIGSRSHRRRSRERGGRGHGL